MQLLGQLRSSARWLRLQGLPSVTLPVQVSSLPAAVRSQTCCQPRKRVLLFILPARWKNAAPAPTKTAAAFLLIPLASAEPCKAATGGQLASPSVFCCGFSGSLASAALGFYCNLKERDRSWKPREQRIRGSLSVGAAARGQADNCGKCLHAALKSVQCAFSWHRLILLLELELGHLEVALYSLADCSTTEYTGRFGCCRAAMEVVGD